MIADFVAVRSSHREGEVAVEVVLGASADGISAELDVLEELVPGGGWYGFESLLVEVAGVESNVVGDNKADKVCVDVVDGDFVVGVIVQVLGTVVEERISACGGFFDGSVVLLDVDFDF